MPKASSNLVPRYMIIMEASADCEVKIEAAAGEGQPKTFSMLAYTGGLLYLAGFSLPVVVDLTGLKVTAKSRPILRDHDVSKIVGHSTEVTNNGRMLKIAGLISGANEHSREVEDSSRNGFPWQSSIGARANRLERVQPGEFVVVNGRKFTGPLLVARQSFLNEASFVPLGADDNTNAKVAAQAAGNFLEIDDMTFEEWIKANFGGMEFSELQLKVLKAQYEADVLEEDDEDEGAAAKTKKNVKASAAGGVGGDGNGQPGGDGAQLDPVINMRASMANELDRFNEIQAACEGYPKIASQAIREGWNIDKTKVAVMNAKMPAAPQPGQSGAPDTGRTIEAALCLSTGMSEDRTAEYFKDEKLMNAAIDLRRRVGLRYLMNEVIRADGGNPNSGTMDEHTIRAAFQASKNLEASGFSTISLPGILGNVANKHLLNAYKAVPSVVFKFCAVASHSDFKAHTKYRLTGKGGFKKVGPTGELKHASLSEESYNNQVDTEGMILSLTRQMIINDDLGALMKIAAIIGRNAALALQEAVYTLLLSNPDSFFHADNKNYMEGADTVLGIEGLTKGEQIFLDQTDSNGKPVLISPAVLLTPSSLKVTGESLYKETKVNETTTANKPKTNENPHAGKFEPASSPYLNNAATAGYSATAWYLFAHPDDVAAMEIAFLQGKQTPTIEGGEADFATLGMQWRGYYDFGVAMSDKRGAMKSKGTA